MYAAESKNKHISLHWLRKLLVYPFGAFISILLAPPSIWSQSYIKELSQPESSLMQKMARCTNGDLLIGDSSFENSSGDGTEPIYMMRQDHCGIIKWSNTYEIKGLSLILTDFKILENNSTIIYGTASKGDNASLFLLRINKDGVHDKFEIVETGFPSHASHPLDIKDDRVLLLGSILKPGAPRTGFIAIFNENLEFIWSKSISPFTHGGTAIFTENNMILCRSGAYHYNFDAEGHLQWAQNLDFSIEPTPIAGPVAMSGGYLFEAFSDDEAFFYKLDHKGNLMWTTSMISSSIFPAAMHVQESGQVLVHYSGSLDSGANLFQLKLSSTGTIISNLEFERSDQSIIGTVSNSVFQDSIIDVLTNEGRDATPAGSNHLMLHYSLNDQKTECIKWVEKNNWQLNPHTLTFPTLEHSIEPLSMSVRKPGGMNFKTSADPFSNICNHTPAPTILQTDSLVQCDGAWTITLPSKDYTWDDGHQDIKRTLKSSGIYSASNNDCMDPILYEYHLNRVVCDCEIYLPNAFSPNGDGINDVFELHTDCNLKSAKVTIYDRWGNQLTNVAADDVLWDGIFKEGVHSEGLYLYTLSYELISDTGGVQMGMKSGTVLLIK